MLTISKLKSEIKKGKKFKFIYFWGGPFSQWKMIPFTIDGIKYNCAEQYMMAEKARLFNDTLILKKILKSPYPKAQKEFGRKVRNFDEKKWNKIKKKVVIKANLAKFSQNKSLYNVLMKTGNSIIVEASPEDTIWGIGISTKNPEKKDPFKWKGKNLLGFCLMEVRKILRDKK